LKVLEEKSEEFNSKINGGAKGKAAKASGEDEDEGVVFGAPVFGQEAAKALARSGHRNAQKAFRGFMDAGGNAERDADGADDEMDRADEIDFDGTRSDDENDADRETELQKDRVDEDDVGTGNRYADAGAEESEEDEFQDSESSDEGSNGSLEETATGYIHDSTARAAAELKMVLNKKNQAAARSESEDGSVPNKRPKLEAPADSTSKVFNDASVQRFIQESGGWTSLKSLMQHFKTALKALPKEVISQRIKDVLLRVADKKEDHVKGTIWVLKSR
jgi:hypothetical protein